MASAPVSPALSLFAGSKERRLAGVLATIVVRAALILAWQLARTVPSGPAQPDGPRMQWVSLPPPAPQARRAPAAPAADVRKSARPAPSRSTRPRHVPPPREEARIAAEPPEGAAPAAANASAARPSAAAIMEQARRSVGSIDRALRKENKPLIVAPPDSPQIRMRQRMEQAHALAAPRLFQAPKVEELVNNTGDGARRTRVITGNGTYCITERSPVTSVEMIQMHGRTRLTNCPEHETPARTQEWRTARD